MFLILSYKYLFELKSFKWDDLENILEIILEPKRYKDFKICI